MNNIYALDNHRHVINKIDRTGKLILQIGQPGDRPGELRLPVHLCVFEDRVFVTDNNAVSMFDLSGKFISRFRKFRRANSMAVFGDKVLVMEPDTQNLVSVYDYEGKKIGSFGEKFQIDYSLYRTWEPKVVDWMIHLGKIVCSEDAVYFISYLVGDIFKYDSEGRLLYIRRFESKAVDENRQLFFDEGLLNETNLTVNKRMFNDAHHFDKKIYLLRQSKGNEGEIWELDEDDLELKKKYKYHAQAENQAPEFLSGSFASIKEKHDGHIIFISFYNYGKSKWVVGTYRQASR